MDSEIILSKRLRLAAQYGHECIVFDLLESGASSNIVDNNANSALHYSLFDSNIFDVSLVVRIVKAVLQHGANLSLRNKKAELVFHLAS